MGFLGEQEEGLLPRTPPSKGGASQFRLGGEKLDWLCRITQNCNQARYSKEHKHNCADPCSERRVLFLQRCAIQLRPRSRRP